MLAYKVEEKEVCCFDTAQLTTYLLLFLINKYIFSVNVSLLFPLKRTYIFLIMFGRDGHCRNLVHITHSSRFFAAGN